MTSFRKKQGMTFWATVMAGMTLAAYPLWYFIAIYLALTPEELRELLRNR